MVTTIGPFKEHIITVLEIESMEAVMRETFGVLELS